MSTIKSGRNDPCYCGSGKKYKQCCMRLQEGRAPSELSPDASIHKDSVTAMEHLVAGRLPQAETLYQQILRYAPRHPEALHYSGLIARMKGDSQAAVDLITKAVAFSPEDAFAHSNLGNALRDLNLLDEALASFDRALQLKPDFVEALYNKGSVLLDLCRYGEALACFDMALQFKPDFVEALCNRGGALLDLNRHDEALVSLDRAIQLKPGDPMAFYNRGNALRNLSRHDEALASYNRALVLNPDYAEALCNRGNTLRDLNRHEEALVSYDRSLQIKPHYSVAFCNRGNVLRDLNRLEEALDSYKQALQFKPDYVDPIVNIGNVLQDLGHHDEALRCYAYALQLKHDCAEAHLNESHSRLLTGDFELGWQKYEWRWVADKQLKNSASNFTQPLWLGEQPLEGKTILLHAEQGMGDAIQFCRYAKVVAERGATVLLEVPASLKSLLADLNGVSRLLVKGETRPHFDYHCPLLSLPLAFNTQLHTIPADIPYIGADPADVQAWRNRLGDKTLPRIGLVWSGNIAHSNDRNRSIPLAELFKLVSGKAHFISLQKEVRESDKRILDERIVHFGDELRDFSDTAALVELMDLVITVDTSVAHLAGAMGKRVWILLPFNPDWRWLQGRDDSPWYPSATLFRQTAIRDWHGVISRVANDVGLFKQTVA